MFIKEIKTRNKKTGKEYVKHALIESIRTPQGARHRTVMQPVHLKLSKELWPVLIAELESRLSGQDSLNLPGVKVPVKVKRAADTAMENFVIRDERRIENRKNISSEEITVNINMAIFLNL